jgi:5'-3' exonuclease
MSYILIDVANLHSRAKFSVRGDIDLKIGMALSITFNSIKKAWTDFGGKHIVFCTEGRSWRKDFYEPYKRNRADNKAAMTPREAEEDKLFWESLNEFIEFIDTKTNCTVLHHPNLEADDLIAGFIQSRPNDKHIIISTDSDFYQLINENVSQYNGVSETHITHTGFFDVKGKPLKDSKTKEIKEPINPNWVLFEKCIRGDTSDNVFSAFPGVRTKGTKNKVGLLEAYADKEAKGYSWNALMLSRFKHHDGTEHRVLDDYNRNVTLIDLSAQPSNIREIINNVVTSIPVKQVPMIGVQFLRFCGKHNLVRLSENSTFFGDVLAKSIEAV